MFEEEMIFKIYVYGTKEEKKENIYSFCELLEKFDFVEFLYFTEPIANKK